MALQLLLLTSPLLLCLGPRELQTQARKRVDLLLAQCFYLWGLTNIYSNQVVGWPPVRAYRMNSLVNQAKNPRAEEDKALDGKGKSEDAFKNILNDHNNTKPKGHIGFVKVNMDGVPIGRKVDLHAHACYETLAQTLEDMFFKSTTTSLRPAESCVQQELPMKLSKLLDGSCEFVLTYEDKEGDWMLVGDVPWRMFVSTVKRLRIMKTSEANGLRSKSPG